MRRTPARIALGRDNVGLKMNMSSPDMACYRYPKEVVIVSPTGQGEEEDDAYHRQDPYF